jgi:hypothetical protein
MIKIFMSDAAGLSALLTFGILGVFENGAQAVTYAAGLCGISDDWKLLLIIVQLTIVFRSLVNRSFEGTKRESSNAKQKRSHRGLIACVIDFLFGSLSSKASGLSNPGLFLVLVAAGELQKIAIERRAKVEEFQRKHRVGLLTLLFTDIVDSTKLKQPLGGREAVTVIQRHHAVIREILGQFSEGEEIETAGNVLVAQGDLAGALKNYRDEFAITEKLASQDPTSADRQNAAAWSRYCVAKVLIRIKDGDRNEAGRLVIEGIDIMTRLEHQGALDTNAQDTLNKLNEIATALTSSSRK